MASTVAEQDACQYRQDTRLVQKVRMRTAITGFGFDAGEHPVLNRKRWVVRIVYLLLMSPPKSSTGIHSDMDDRTKLRIRELMFHVVPDPDEIITDEVLAQSEDVNYQVGEQMKAEFRSIIESLDDWPDVKHIVLGALDDMEASSNDSPSDTTEWMNVRDVMGRRIRKALASVL